MRKAKKSNQNVELSNKIYSTNGLYKISIVDSQFLERISDRIILKPYRIQNVEVIKSEPNMLFLNLQTRRNVVGKEPINYIMMGEEICDAFMSEMGAKSIDDLCGKDVYVYTIGSDVIKGISKYN